MPLPLTVSCFSKIQIGLPFWYRLTRVVPDKGPLKGCVYIVSTNSQNNDENSFAWASPTVQVATLALFCSLLATSDGRGDFRERHTKQATGDIQGGSKKLAVDFKRMCQ